MDVYLPACHVLLLMNAYSTSASRFGFVTSAEFKGNDRGTIGFGLGNWSEFLVASRLVVIVALLVGKRLSIL